MIEIKQRFIRKVQFDEYTNIEFERDDLDLFLKYAKAYQSRFYWDQQTDPTYKSFFSTMVNIIRGMEPEFMSTKKVFEFSFKYHELAAIERIVKIIQIEIGEETEDQKFFQDIASKLYPIL